MSDYDTGYQNGYEAGREAFLEELRNPLMVCSACRSRVVRHADDSWGHYSAVEAAACDGLRAVRGDGGWEPISDLCQEAAAVAVCGVTATTTCPHCGLRLCEEHAGLASHR